MKHYLNLQLPLLYLLIPLHLKMSNALGEGFMGSEMY